MKFHQFNVESYLQERGISYTDSGKNTTEGWVEVQCPFCGDDPSTHLGISPERLLHCWRCGEKGDIRKYIKTIEDCSWGKVSEIIKEFTDTSIPYPSLSETFHNSSRRKTVMPKNIENLSEIHYQYLEGRGFDPVKIERKYQLKALGRASGEDRKFQYRIIIPIVMGGFVVNFVARDFTGRRSPKYINQENEKSILPTKDCLYNIDTVRDIALVVEGVTDVWRMGDGAVATLGIEYSIKQINLLIKKKPKKCYVMFDSEERAQEQANKISNILSGFMKTIMLELDSGDPGDLSQEEANRIRREIGLD